MIFAVVLIILLLIYWYVWSNRSSFNSCNFSRWPTLDDEDFAWIPRNIEEDGNLRTVIKTYPYELDGGDIDILEKSTPQECYNACVTNNNCVGFAFDYNQSIGYLRKSF